MIQFYLLSPCIYNVYPSHKAHRYFLFAGIIKVIFLNAFSFHYYRRVFEHSVFPERQRWNFVPLCFILSFYFFKKNIRLCVILIRRNIVHFFHIVMKGLILFSKGKTVCFEHFCVFIQFFLCFIELA